MSVQETCVECGMVYWLSDEVYAKLRENHKNFYCPAGHPQHYSIKSPTEKLQEERDMYYRWYKNKGEQFQLSQRRLSALRGVITRMKKVIPLAEAERKLIKAALKETNGHRAKAANLLGVGERTLYRKIKKYNL